MPLAAVCSEAKEVSEAIRLLLHRIYVGRGEFGAVVAKRIAARLEELVSGADAAVQVGVLAPDRAHIPVLCDNAAMAQQEIGMDIVKGGVPECRDCIPRGNFEQVSGLDFLSARLCLLLALAPRLKKASSSLGSILSSSGASDKPGAIHTYNPRRRMVPFSPTASTCPVPVPQTPIS